MFSSLCVRHYLLPALGGGIGAAAHTPRRTLPRPEVYSYAKLERHRVGRGKPFGTASARLAKPKRQTVFFTQLQPRREYLLAGHRAIHMKAYDRIIVKALGKYRGVRGTVGYSGFRLFRMPSAAIGG